MESLKIDTNIPNLIQVHIEGETGHRHPGNKLKAMWRHPSTEVKNTAWLTKGESYLECCKAPLGSPGCINYMVMECCEGERGSRGCQEYYKCCNQPLDSPGCQEEYRCCPGKGRDPPECIKVCIECKAEWGQPANQDKCTGKHDFESER